MISIIIPVYNEEETLTLLHAQIKAECKKLKQLYELIFVNDGSKDNSAHILLKLQREDKSVQVATHRKQSGKGQALQTGLSAASGSPIIFMDADLQNDPADLGKFISKIDEGYDVVNGYRRVRRDTWDKTLPSKIYNLLFISYLFRLKLHDINCGFKAIRAQVFDSVELYGDNYRILPVLAKHEGFRVTEVEVVHHSRRHGASKYGAWRMLFGLFDVLTQFFLLRFVEKPLHFFGALGVLLFSFGIIILLYLGILRLMYGILLYRRPIIFLGMLLVIVGVQIIATGFIGELIVYLNKRGKSR